MGSSATIFLSIASMLYMIMVAIVYFTKEKVNTSENKIFSKLVLISLASLFSEIYITFIPIDMKIPLFVISLKVYLILCVFWLSYFMEYVFIITRNNENKLLINYKQKYKKTYIRFWIITAFVITPYSIRLAKKVGAVDYPNDRRVNKKPMPRLGGIAVIAGFLVSAIYLIITMRIENNIDFITDGLGKKLLGFLFGAMVLGITCYIDDVKGISPLVKLAGQLIAAIIVVSCGVRIDNFTIPFKENSIMINEVISYILTIGWIVGITNAINLIDGLDGLSSGITLIACISMLIIFSLNESPLIAIILITALAGAIVGFLPYNFNPAKTFIGDVGSNFMGYAISIISILGVAKTYTAIVIIAPIIVLALPIFDTLWAIVRRIVKTKSIKGVFKADKGHLHHRLMAKGYTQRQAVLILYGVTATLGMIAIILLDSGIWKALSFALLVIAIVAIGYKDIVHLRDNEEIENEKLKSNRTDKNI